MKVELDVFDELVNIMLQFINTAVFRCLVNLRLHKYYDKVQYSTVQGTVRILASKAKLLSGHS